MMQFNLGNITSWKIVEKFTRWKVTRQEKLWNGGCSSYSNPYSTLWLRRSRAQAQSQRNWLYTWCQSHNNSWPWGNPVQENCGDQEDWNRFIPSDPPLCQPERLWTCHWNCNGQQQTGSVQRRLEKQLEAIWVVGIGSWWYARPIKNFLKESFIIL